jgi:hypothetical protein
VSPLPGKNVQLPIISRCQAEALEAGFARIVLNPKDAKTRRNTKEKNVVRLRPSKPVLGEGSLNHKDAKAGRKTKEKMLSG